MKILWECPECGESDVLELADCCSLAVFEDALETGLRREHTARSLTCMSSDFRLQMQVLKPRMVYELRGFTK